MSCRMVRPLCADVWGFPFVYGQQAFACFFFFAVPTGEVYYFEDIL